MKKAGILGGLLVIVLLIPAIASAGQWWKDEALKGKLKLTEEQEKKIDAIVDASMKERKEQAGKIREKIRALNGLLSKEKIDKKAVDKTLVEVIKLREALLRNNLEMKLKVRDVLSEEQIKTLLKERPRVFSLRSRWAKKRPLKRVMKKDEAPRDKPTEKKK